jgi:hypothetical protein
MTTLLIIFFTSLLGLVVMIGRRIMLIKDSQIILEENISFGEPYIEEIKQATAKKMKQYGYVVITSTLRFSIKSSRFLNEKGSDISKRIRSMLIKSGEGESQKEVSNFLKMVSEYKNKINRIKNRIREEEGIEIK